MFGLILIELWKFMLAAGQIFITLSLPELRGTYSPHNHQKA